MENQKELVQVLNTELAIEMPEQIPFTEIRETLSEHINSLIETNFQKLVSLLYRIDVSESKLKTLLQEKADVNAAMIITDLIIERQLQKIIARKQYSKQDKNISEDQKW